MSRLETQQQDGRFRPHLPWKARAFNAIAGPLRRLGIPFGKLSASHLVEVARRDSEISDLDDPKVRQPLEVLVESLERDAQLTPVGRVLAGKYLTLALMSRLLVADERRRFPETETLKIRRPLYVLGLPRTGTTLLYNLLAQDPRARPLRMWESYFPAKRASERQLDHEPRKARCAEITRRMVSLAPNLPKIHPIDPLGPEECFGLLANTFVSPFFLTRFHVPTYFRWLLDQPREAMDHAYQEYFEQLQCLQRQQPALGHWLLKSPLHLFGLASLTKTLPEACIVQTHRDPSQVVPSACSLFETVRGVSTRQVDRKSLGREVLELLRTSLERGQAARKQLSADRVFDVHYEQLLENPLATVRSIYEHFGYQVTSEHMHRAQAWLNSNPRSKLGVHRYSLADYGLSASDLSILHVPRRHLSEPRSPFQ